VKSITPTTATGQSIQRLAFTTEETAAALGIKPTTVWRLTQRGLLKPNRATRRPLYALSDIERFLAEGKA
jgi:hypothetical protein